MSLDSIVAPMVERIRSGEIEVYNEFSLQHELGIYLRNTMTPAKVWFERNVRYFFGDVARFVKREIDISVVSGENNAPTWAIELKFPRNGQYPEQMFSFCKDIVFCEQLAAAGFANAGLMIFADDKLFWQGPTDGIYGFFRGSRPLGGVIQKPTGARNEQLNVKGRYAVRWQQLTKTTKYAVIEVSVENVKQSGR